MCNSISTIDYTLVNQVVFGEEQMGHSTYCRNVGCPFFVLRELIALLTFDCGAIGKETEDSADGEE